MAERITIRVGMRGLGRWYICINTYICLWVGVRKIKPISFAHSPPSPGRGSSPAFVFRKKNINRKFYNENRKFFLNLEFWFVSF